MIVCSAIRENGLIHVLPRPKRHHDIIHAMVTNGYKKPIQGEQGFIDHRGHYLGRESALQEALLCDQLKMENKCGNQKELFSEDLW